MIVKDKMPKVKAYFNGTGFYYPSDQEPAEIFATLDENLLSWDKSDLEFYRKQLVEMEQAIFDAEKLLMTPGINLFQEQIIEKAALSLGMNQGLKGEEPTLLFIHIWFMNIRFLIMNGFIKDDNKNGFLFSSHDLSSMEASILTKTVKNRCAVCDIECTKKCSKCQSVYYCCVEHQMTHWKSGHKKLCKLINLI